MEDILTVNTDVDRHTLEYRVASLVVLSAYQDARALGKERAGHFDTTSSKKRSELYKARCLARNWQELKETVTAAPFAGMLRAVGMSVEETRQHILSTARGL